MRNIEQKMQWIPLKMTTGCPQNCSKLKIILVGTTRAILCWHGSKKWMVKWPSIWVSLYISNKRNIKQIWKQLPLKISTGCPKNGVKLKIILLGLIRLYYVVVAPKSAWLSGRIIWVNLHLSEIRNNKK